MPEDLDPFVVSVIHGAQLAKFSESMGVDFEKCCVACNIEPCVFQSVVGMVSNFKFAQLLEILTDASGDPAFGFKYGEYLDMTLLWPIATATKRAPTLRKALDFLIKSQQVGFNYSKFELTVDGDQARLVWDHSPFVFGMDSYWDFNLVLGYRMFSGFGEVDRNIVELTTTRSTPKHIAEYDRLFLGRMKFGAKETSVKFDSFVLDRPNPEADYGVYTLLRLQVQAFLKLGQFTTPLEQRTRQKIFISFEDGEPTLASVAEMLNISERSFQRQLLHLGLNFRALLDKSRRDLSCHLLKIPRLSIEDIAQRVGFKSTSAYSRAAVDWYGHSPSQYRKQLQGTNCADLTNSANPTP